MTPAEVCTAILDAVRAAVDAGELEVAVPERAVVERPKNKEYGDYATNVALQLARPAGRPSREVAELLAGRLRAADGIAAVEVAGPGFLNVRLRQAALGELARTVVQAGPAYGHSAVNAGRRLNLEFISANPTGPLLLSHARWAAVGDALARLLAATGAQVTREYYFNDTGAQVDRFAESLYAAARGLPTPAEGYAGAYVGEVAQQIVSAVPDVLDRPVEEALEVFRHEGLERMFAQIKSVLADFGVVFDVYFLERSLHESGAVQAALKRLREEGHLYEADGALWLRSTEFGDDRDRVVVRSDGTTTYFTQDAAYYLDKRERGFDKVVIMLGADHHGYVNRLRAMACCFGDDPDQTLEVLIGQLVRLVRSGQVIQMSKRAGIGVTLEELVEAVGVDSARYSLARASTDSTLDLDLDLITRQDAENPVFYVQYAHARLCSLLRNAAELGIERADDYDPALLATNRESDLLRALGEFPRVVSGAAELRAPHRVARYLEELAGTYHRFYDSCRVLPVADDRVTPVTTARLWLCEATRIVLANGLGLLGVSAPVRM